MINSYRLINPDNNWINYKVDEIPDKAACQKAVRECQTTRYIEKAKALALDSLAIFSAISLSVVALAVGKVAGFMVGVATLPLQFFIPFYALLLFGCTIGSAATFLYVTLRPIWNKLKADANAHKDYAQHLQQQQELIQNRENNLKA